MPARLRTLLDGLFDDAGLFPPARRPMAEALNAHVRALESPHQRMVGPFLCPAGRLEELDACLASGLPRPERLGVVLSNGDNHLSRVLARPGLVQVEAPLGFILPPEATRVRRYLELPPRGEPAELVARAVATGAGVKVRCGGATPDMVPPVERLADILYHAAARNATLKATAGLHQPFRHPDPVTGVVNHGFVNLLAAASAALAGDGIDALAALLAAPESARDTLFARVDRRARELVISIGTCSLDEPVEALEGLTTLGSES